LQVTFTTFSKLLRATALIFALVQFNGCSSKTSTNAGAGEAGGEYEFAGVGRVTPNEDGTWEIWWQTVTGVPNLSFRVFQRTIDGSYDWQAPVTQTPENAYTSNDLRLIGNSCFVVRFSQDGNNADQNEKEMCTNHDPYSFEGAEDIVSLRDGTYLIKWPEPPFKGVQFQVFSKETGKGDWTSVGFSARN
jgi:hypothetical protein